MMNKIMHFQSNGERVPVHEWLLFAHTAPWVAPLLFALVQVWLVLNIGDISSEIVRLFSAGPAVDSLSVLLSGWVAVFLSLFFGLSIHTGTQIKQESSRWILSREEWRDFVTALHSSSRLRAVNCGLFVTVLLLSAPTTSHQFWVWGTLPLIVVCALGLCWYAQMATRLMSPLRSGGEFVPVSRSAQTVKEKPVPVCCPM